VLLQEAILACLRQYAGTDASNATRFGDKAIP
jgi:hypothetical protein